MILIDKLCYSSRFRYLNASFKAAFSMSTLLLCIICRSIAISTFIVLAMGLLTVYGGGIPGQRYLKLLRIPILFLVLSVIAIIVNFSAVPLSAFAIPFGDIYITSSLDSLLYAAQLFLTALGGVSCLYFLSLSTSITDLLPVLKNIRCPELVIELMLLIYRFIFVLLDMADALTTAQHSRLGNKDFRTSCRSMANLITVLFIRSLKKSSMLYDAMESRCYNGTIKVLTERYPVQKKHVAASILFELTLIATAVLLQATGFYI